ncbi:hypothetical protein RND81_09G101400 [Saponaria officinalis]|uniref:Late embryogenesis abundant protein LEA-2 subgroup domain-containing protein n=1 Tax=Saponaria officinalis TaxID=3572 RepID=A0AAW1IJV1_SAPOF
MNKKASCYCILFIILVLGGVAVLIAWAVDKPKNPTFFINQASINDFNLNSDNRLNATFTLVVQSHNRDPKYTINYNYIMVAIFHDTSTLAYVPNVGPYKQDHGEDLIFTVQPLSRNFKISESDVAADLRNEMKSGQLNFEVRIRAYVKFQVKGWKRKRYTLGIVCAPLLINLASMKTFEGTDCSVDRF